tara:strand:+ start:192 stop:548 length:357 start_codon:yes stop_codon:yes gene_type:complete
MRFSILVIVGLLISGSAMAQSSRTASIQHFLMQCLDMPNTPTGAYDYGVCDGKISAVRFMANNVQNSANRTSSCVPKSITNGQIKQVFIVWARANPKFWHLPIEIGILTAMNNAWRCN